MEEEYAEHRIIRYRSSILLIMFIGIMLAMLIFLITVLVTIGSDRQGGTKYTAKVDPAIRGKIVSADGYTLSYSQKLFRAEVDTRSIDPKKLDLFINLFSIYSGISKEKVQSKFLNSQGKSIRGRIIISDDIDVRLASDLQTLAHKLNRLKVFQPIDKSRPHLVLGLDIVPDHEHRYFPHKDLLAPALGYVRAQDVGGYKSPVPIKGLEQSYNGYLQPDKNGLIKGRRDVLGTVIRSGESQKVDRVDGMDLYLNIAIDFQQSIEQAVDQMKQQIGAEEIMVAVMDSQTGALITLASSERFDPGNIRQNEIDLLNPNFSEYLYEPGSVIKPLTLSVAMDHEKIDLNKKITLGGKYKVNKSFTITDDEYFKALTPPDIIIYSSNIGIAKIAWQLSGKEFYDGLRNFGVAQRSGIDLSRELEGTLKAPYLLDYPIYGGNTAYGYGVTVNFMQLVKAYSAFNNEGIMVTPKLVNRLTDDQGRYFDSTKEQVSYRACSAQTAATMKEILKDVVEIGTGTAAQYDGLEVGGKTGTAHIAQKGKYVDEYHSSFYGFVNDDQGHRYTVGVLVVKPKKVYFASQTSAPMFYDVVDTMVKFKYLVPDEKLAATQYKRRTKMRERRRAAYIRQIQEYNKAHGITE